MVSQENTSVFSSLLHYELKSCYQHFQRSSYEIILTLQMLWSKKLRLNSYTSYPTICYSLYSNIRVGNRTMKSACAASCINHIPFLIKMEIFQQNLQIISKKPPILVFIYSSCQKNVQLHYPLQLQPTHLLGIARCDGLPWFSTRNGYRNFW